MAESLDELLVRYGLKEEPRGTDYLLPLKAALGILGGVGGGLAGAFDPEAYEQARLRNIEEFGTGGLMKKAEAIPGAGDVAVQSWGLADAGSGLGRIAEPVVRMGGNILGDPTSLLGAGALAKLAAGGVRAAGLAGRAGRAGRAAERVIGTAEAAERIGRSGYIGGKLGAAARGVERLPEGVQGPIRVLTPAERAGRVLQAGAGLPVSPLAGMAYAPELIGGVAGGAEQALTQLAEGQYGEAGIAGAQTALLTGLGYLVGAGALREANTLRRAIELSNRVETTRTSGEQEDPGQTATKAGQETAQQQMAAFRRTPEEMFGAGEEFDLAAAPTLRRPPFVEEAVRAPEEPGFYEQGFPRGTDVVLPQEPGTLAEALRNLAERRRQVPEVAPRRPEAPPEAPPEVPPEIAPEAPPVAPREAVRVPPAEAPARAAQADRQKLVTLGWPEEQLDRLPPKLLRGAAAQGSSWEAASLFGTLEVQGRSYPDLFIGVAEAPPKAPTAEVPPEAARTVRMYSGVASEETTPTHFYSEDDGGAAAAAEHLPPGGVVKVVDVPGDVLDRGLMSRQKSDTSSVAENEYVDRAGLGKEATVYTEPVPRIVPEEGVGLAEARAAEPAPEVPAPKPEPPAPKEPPPEAPTDTKAWNPAAKTWEEIDAAEGTRDANLVDVADRILADNPSLTKPEILKSGEHEWRSKQIGKRYGVAEARQLRNLLIAKAVKREQLGGLIEPEAAVPAPKEAIPEAAKEPRPEAPEEPISIAKPIPKRPSVVPLPTVRRPPPAAPATEAEISSRVFAAVQDYTDNQAAGGALAYIPTMREALKDVLPGKQFDEYLSKLARDEVGHLHYHPTPSQLTEAERAAMIQRRAARPGEGGDLGGVEYLMAFGYREGKAPVPVPGRAVGEVPLQEPVFAQYGGPEAPLPPLARQPKAPPGKRRYRPEEKGPLRVRYSEEQLGEILARENAARKAEAASKAEATRVQEALEKEGHGEPWPGEPEHPPVVFKKNVEEKLSKALASDVIARKFTAEEVAEIARQSLSPTISKRVRNIVYQAMSVEGVVNRDIAEELIEAVQSESVVRALGSFSAAKGISRNKVKNFFTHAYNVAQTVARGKLSKHSEYKALPKSDFMRAVAKDLDEEAVEHGVGDSVQVERFVRETLEVGDSKAKQRAVTEAYVALPKNERVVIREHSLYDKSFSRIAADELGVKAGGPFDARRKELSSLHKRAVENFKAEGKKRGLTPVEEKAKRFAHLEAVAKKRKGPGPVEYRGEVPVGKRRLSIRMELLDDALGRRQWKITRMSGSEADRVAVVARLIREGDIKPDDMVAFPADIVGRVRKPGSPLLEEGLLAKGEKGDLAMYGYRMFKATHPDVTPNPSATIDMLGLQGLYKSLTETLGPAAGRIIVHGADLLRTGVRDVGAWSNRMVREFGDIVKGALRQIYNAIQSRVGVKMSGEVGRKETLAALGKLEAPSKEPILTRKVPEITEPRLMDLTAGPPSLAGKKIKPVARPSDKDVELFAMNLERLGIDQAEKEEFVRIVKTFPENFKAFEKVPMHARDVVAHAMALGKELTEEQVRTLLSGKGMEKLTDLDKQAVYQLGREFVAAHAKKVGPARKAYVEALQEAVARGDSPLLDPATVAARKAFLKELMHSGATANASIGNARDAARHLAFLRVIAKPIPKGVTEAARVKQGLQEAKVPETMIDDLVDIYKMARDDNTGAGWDQYTEAFQLALEHGHKVTFKQKAIEWVKAGLLGWPSWSVNIMSNVINKKFDDTARSVAVLIDKFRHKVTGAERELYHTPRHLAWASTVRGLSVAASYIREDMERIVKLQAMTPRDLAGSFMDAPHKAGAIRGKKGEFIRIPFKIMGTGDNAFKVWDMENAITNVAWRKAVKEVGEEASDEAKATAYKRIEKELRDAKELDKLIAEPRARSDFKSQAEYDKYKNSDEFRQNMKDLEEAKRLFKEYGGDWEEIAERMQRVTFQLPLGEKFKTFPQLGKLMGAYHRAAMDNILLEGITPFRKTPGNIALETLLKSPVGLYATMRKYHQGKLTAKEMEVELAKGMLGTTLGTVVGVSLVGAGMSGMISGQGPQDPKMRQALMKTGWQPYSVKVSLPGGDHWIAYNRLEPLSSILGFAADVAEGHMNGDFDSAKKAASRLTASLAENLTNKTFLSGLEGLATAWHDPLRYGERYIKQLTGMLAPNVVGFIPFGHMARAIDPVYRKTEAFTLDPIVAKTPLVSQILPAQVTPMGEERVRPGTFLERMISPLYRRKVEEGPLAALGQEMHDIGYVPSLPRNSVTINGRKIYLVQDEIDRLEKAQLEATKHAAGLIKDPAYLRLAKREEDLGPRGGKTRGDVIKKIYRNRRRRVLNAIRAKAWARFRKSGGEVGEPV